MTPTPEWKETLALLLPAIVTAVGVARWLQLYLSYGEEYRVSPLSEPVTAPPYDWAPREVGYLRRWGEVDLPDMVATILDLAARGAIRLDPEPIETLLAGGIAEVDQEYDYLISRGARGHDDLTESERFLIDEILLWRCDSNGRASLTTTMIEGARAGDMIRARAWQWKQLAEKGPHPVALEEPVSLQMSGKGEIIGLAMVLGFLLIMFTVPSVFGFVPLVVGGALTVGSRVIRRRTREAAEALAKWESYRETLSARPGLDDEPTQTYVLEGRPLIYAVSLGLAPKLVHRYRLLYPGGDGSDSDQDQYPSAFPRRITD